ncbi:hypothetical protein [Aquimarina mytili]|uniref:Uncharacterized protein n=1 Tax=Aquimarina mytili TaxID=874423 RepID=A0A937D7F5_9FLAO|nr:hypothetical protein [Aquimarina mytili]MBL0685464.1 hypothetical protein [Aquimarina mytili]
MNTQSLGLNRINTIVFVLALAFSVLGNAQISVGPKHIGKPGKFKKENIEKFKKTKTIFVLSNQYEKEVYEDILKASWTATPFEVVPVSEFKLRDYLKDEYSIATLRGHRVDKTTKSGALVHYLYMYLEVIMYQNEELTQKLAENEGKKEKKLRKIINKHKISFARFELFPKDEFIKIAIKSSNEEIMAATMNDDVFFNYQPGMLKNYLQKTSQLLNDEKIYWMYEDEELPELKNLGSTTLYIPDYTKTKYNAFTMSDKEQDESKSEKLYADYEFTHEFISVKDLNTKILNNEEFYYLRYVRVNSQKFIEIVNSKSGDVIYRNYETGLAYNLKPKHIKELNKAIKKVIKKASK